MDYAVPLDPLDLIAFFGVYLLAALLLLWVLARTLGKQYRQVSDARYDYKVVDLIILQDPGNHERQIQTWADEGWSIVACLPLIGGATEGAPEVRYILSKPWQIRRLARVLKAEAKQALGKQEPQQEQGEIETRERKK